MNDPAVAIDIDSASSGMVLAGDLHDSRGAVLLPGGATLSDATIVSLRRRGIERLCVLVPAAATDDAAAEAERVRRCARLQRLFRRSAGSGATDLLLEQLRQYRQNGPT